LGVTSFFEGAFAEDQKCCKIERTFVFIFARMPATPDPARSTRPPRLPAARAGAMQKGQQTKAAIVEAALGLATHIGLEGLSIGALADITGMSKSGVFAHFGSREELQISVIREYHTASSKKCSTPPCLRRAASPRLRAMFDNWMKRTSIEIDSGCIYISGAVEFDDRTGPVRDALASSVMTWHAAMRRAIEQCKELGELRAEVNEEQMLFEIHGLILALHYEARFLQTPGSIERAVMGFKTFLRAAAKPGTAAKAPAHRPFSNQTILQGVNPMPTYTPPLRDMQFVMHEVFKVTDEFKAMPQHAEVDVDTINAVIEEAGKFASEVIFPLNISGDTEGCTLDKATHEVKTPTGFKEAYDKYVEGGWAALSCDAAYGGQGLPFVLNQCLYEMMNSANQAWTMYPGLSHGAYEALHAHGTDEQKKPCTCPS
jgi:AcrR family transcriptional regulator